MLGEAAARALGAPVVEAHVEAVAGEVGVVGNVREHEEEGEDAAVYEAAHDLESARRAPVVEVEEARELAVPKNKKLKKKKKNERFFE